MIRKNNHLKLVLLKSKVFNNGSASAIEVEGSKPATILLKLAPIPLSSLSTRLLFSPSRDDVDDEGTSSLPFANV